MLATVPNGRPDPRKGGIVLPLFSFFPRESRQFGVDLCPRALAERAMLAEPLEHVAFCRVVAEHHGSATVPNIYGNTIARSTDRAAVTIGRLPIFAAKSLDDVVQIDPCFFGRPSNITARHCLPP